MTHVEPLFIALITGVIGLAMVAVLVSQNAQTGTVLTQGGTALASVIQAAVSPVSGGNALGAAFGGAATSALGSLL